MRIHKPIFILLLTMFTSVANVALIFQASGVTSSSSNDGIFGPNGVLINQSGLSASYTSGVTDFDSFVATTTGFNGPNGTSLGSFEWFGGPVSFDFTFDNLLSVDRFALWNQSGSASVNEFELFATASGLFDDLISLGSFSASQGGVATIGTFASANILGIRLVVNSNFGFLNSVRFDEFAAGGELTQVNDISEPTLGFLGGPLIMLGWMRRRA